MSFAIRVTDDRTANHFERGVRLASKGQYREALKCFEKVLSIAPGRLDALNCRADCSCAPRAPRAGHRELR